MAQPEVRAPPPRETHAAGPPPLPPPLQPEPPRDLDLPSGEGGRRQTGLVARVLGREEHRPVRRVGETRGALRPVAGVTLAAPGAALRGALLIPPDTPPREVATPDTPAGDVRPLRRPQRIRDAGPRLHTLEVAAELLRLLPRLRLPRPVLPLFLPEVAAAARERGLAPLARLPEGVAREAVATVAVGVGRAPPSGHTPLEMEAPSLALSGHAGTPLLLGRAGGRGREGPADPSCEASVCLRADAGLVPPPPPETCGGAPPRCPEATESRLDARRRPRPLGEGKEDEATLSRHTPVTREVL